jgi:hypothetical protein
MICKISGCRRIVQGFRKRPAFQSPQRPRNIWYEEVYEKADADAELPAGDFTGRRLLFHGGDIPAAEPFWPTTRIWNKKGLLLIGIADLRRPPPAKKILVYPESL